MTSSARAWLAKPKPWNWPAFSSATTPGESSTWRDIFRSDAGLVVPHELNFRLHPGVQRSAIQALYQEVGFARSLLAYELPDGRLKLIDGHLRRDLDPNMEVEVEILDVNEEEARTLLLSIDPLAALAETQQQLHDRLMEVTPTSSEELKAAWQAAV